MNDSKYYLITKADPPKEFEDLNLLYKFLLDSNIRQGSYVIIKGEIVL